MSPICWHISTIFLLLYLSYSSGQIFPPGKHAASGFVCRTDFGHFAHSTNCSRYFVCLFGEPIEKSCTEPLVYSERLETCDWPRNVPGCRNRQRITPSPFRARSVADYARILSRTRSPSISDTRTTSIFHDESESFKSLQQEPIHLQANWKLNEDKEDEFRPAVAAFYPTDSAFGNGRDIGDSRVRMGRLSGRERAGNVLSSRIRLLEATGDDLYTQQRQQRHHTQFLEDIDKVVARRHQKLLRSTANNHFTGLDDKFRSQRVRWPSVKSRERSPTGQVTLSSLSPRRPVSLSSLRAPGAPAPSTFVTAPHGDSFAGQRATFFIPTTQGPVTRRYRVTGSGRHHEAEPVSTGASIISHGAVGQRTHSRNPLEWAQQELQSTYHHARPALSHNRTPTTPTKHPNSFVLSSNKEEFHNSWAHSTSQRPADTQKPTSTHTKNKNESNSALVSPSHTKNVAGGTKSSKFSSPELSTTVESPAYLAFYNDTIYDIYYIYDEDDVQYDDYDNDEENSDELRLSSTQQRRQKSSATRKNKVPSTTAKSTKLAEEHIEAPRHQKPSPLRSNESRKTPQVFTKSNDVRRTPQVPIKGHEVKKSQQAQGMGKEVRIIQRPPPLPSSKTASDDAWVPITRPASNPRPTNQRVRSNSIIASPIQTGRTASNHGIPQSSRKYHPTAKSSHHNGTPRSKQPVKVRGRKPAPVQTLRIRRPEISVAEQSTSASVNHNLVALDRPDSSKSSIKKTTEPSVLHEHSTVTSHVAPASVGEKPDDETSTYHPIFIQTVSPMLPVDFTDDLQSTSESAVVEVRASSNQNKVTPTEDAAQSVSSTTNASSSVTKTTGAPNSIEKLETSTSAKFPIVIEVKRIPKLAGRIPHQVGKIRMYRRRNKRPIPRQSGSNHTAPANVRNNLAAEPNLHQMSPSEKSRLLKAVRTATRIGKLFPAVASKSASKNHTLVRTNAELGKTKVSQPTANIKHVPEVATVTNSIISDLEIGTSGEQFYDSPKRGTNKPKVNSVALVWPGSRPAHDQDRSHLAFDFAEDKPDTDTDEKSAEDSTQVVTEEDIALPAVLSDGQRSLDITSSRKIASLFPKKLANSIISSTTKDKGIWKYPPKRPDPIYKQPAANKPAARCSADQCKLPDCYCGGPTIPGSLKKDQTPQLVLLTFDDSINELNKDLYDEMFDQGRTNANGCPISATFFVSHEWTNYGLVRNMYANGHEIASHTISHSHGEEFSEAKWEAEIEGQREILAAYGGVRLEDIRGMRAPFLSIGGNKMYNMLYKNNFTYDSSMPVYDINPPSWPFTLDYHIRHECMIKPCPDRSYPGVWQLPMVMWEDLNGGRCNMVDACARPETAEQVFEMHMKNFNRHFNSNRAVFPLFFHSAWFNVPHLREGFLAFLDHITSLQDVWLVTAWQAIQWMRDPQPLDNINQFKPFGCQSKARASHCLNPRRCKLPHGTGIRYMSTCQGCPSRYPWTGDTGVKRP